MLCRFFDRMFLLRAWLVWINGLAKPLQTPNTYERRNKNSGISVEIRGLLRRLQQLETTISHLNRTATEVSEQRESAVEMTHQQLLVNQQMMQQVTISDWFKGYFVSVLFLTDQLNHFVTSTASGGPEYGKRFIVGWAKGARDSSWNIEVNVSALVGKDHEHVLKWTRDQHSDLTKIHEHFRLYVQYLNVL